MVWASTHWRLALSALTGVPVLVGVAIGLLIGWIVF